MKLSLPSTSLPLLHILLPELTCRFTSLGQFNILSIQLSFTLITYPCLILAYLGQGARLIVDGDSVLSNVFYQTIPGPVGGPLYWYVPLLRLLQNTGTDIGH